MTAAMNSSLEGLAPLDAMRPERRWVVWKIEQDRKGKPTKRPYQPDNPGKRASVDNRNTWSTYTKAREVELSGEFSGIGFMLTKHEQIRALDLDLCRDPDTGAVAPWAQHLIAKADSYCEVTPSGTGFRIIGVGRTRDNQNRNIKVPHVAKVNTPYGEEAPHCEVYVGGGRYITITGDHVPQTPETLGDIDHIIDDVLSWAEPDERSSATDPEPDDGGSIDEKSLHTDLLKLIRDGVDEGQRSDQFHHVVGWLKDRGHPPHRITELLARYPDGIAAKYLTPTDRLASEVGRSYRNCKTKAPGPGNGNVVDGVSEDALALAFASLHADRLRYDHSAGRWYEWQGTHWQRDEVSATVNLVRAHCRDTASRQTPAVADRLRKRLTITSVESLARTDTRFAVTSERWDADPFLLGTPGGVVDLKTGVVRRTHPDDYITKLTGATPSAAASCPLWLGFLEDATKGDAGLIRFIQQMCGYALTGDTREHALFFVYGPGGNGKSVFLNTLAGILGEYATASAMDTFTASKGDRHSTELAMLRGARLVSASETEEGRAWAEARIKQLTGGDIIVARFMRQDNFEFRPQFKLIVVGNHQPALQNVDDAARRRFNIIPFIHRPPNPDPELEVKLEAEWSGILRWMIQGCLDWQANGLVRPDTVKAATNAYFDDQDVFSQWLDEDCHVEIDNPYISDRTADLYQSWLAFADQRGEPHWTDKKFSGHMTKHGFRRERKYHGGSTQRIYVGVELIKTRENRASTQRDY